MLPIKATTPPIPYSKLPLFSLKYDSSSQSWKETVSPDITLPNLTTTELKTVTYNVWLKAHNFTDRCEAISTLLESLEADIICLQEVTHAFLDKLLLQAWVKKYYISNTTFPKESYGVMILSKIPCKFYTVELPTEMDRLLLMAEMMIHGKKAVFETVHLESLKPEDNSSFRKRQLQICYEVNKEYEIAVLMGDFNFDRAEEEVFIAEEYDDVWKKLWDLQKEPGYTMPKRDVYRAWRPDRVLARKGDSVTAEEGSVVGMELIGKYKVDRETWEKSQEVKTASDHFALSVTWNVPMA